LIAGAGPTGLVLALWLVRQGVKVRIGDRSAGPGTSSRAMSVQARTLELNRQLCLAAALAASGDKDGARKELDGLLAGDMRFAQADDVRKLSARLKAGG
jgi:2-polyprenyl-6-methoxyphenol hydroxylase-like FAD-dependent oxidoreductase